MDTSVKRISVDVAVVSKGYKLRMALQMAINLRIFCPGTIVCQREGVVLFLKVLMSNLIPLPFSNCL